MRKTRSLFGEDAFLEEKEPSILGVGRFRAIAGVLLALPFLFGMRLYELQILEGTSLRDIAEENRLQTVLTLPSRGRLYDRLGNVLAENTPVYRLLARVSAFSFSKEHALDQEQAKTLLAPVLVACGISFESVRTALEEASASAAATALLADRVTPACALTFLGSVSLPQGITLEVTEERSYVTNRVPTLSHVLGYTGKLSEEEYVHYAPLGYRAFDVIGKQGIEALFEERLHGKNGETLLEVDSMGAALRTVFTQNAVPGEDMTLSLDAELHSAIENILAEKLVPLSVRHASVVMMRPDTGEVLALVSYPAFDANAFVGGISQENYTALVEDINAPLFNRSIAGSYPAGSTMKPVYAALALEDGIITPTTTFLSTGGVMLGNRFFPDWRPGGHGMTNVYHAIADSVNTFFYLVGGGTNEQPGLGVEKLMNFARRFGFGEYTGIGLSGETRGFLPSPAWKQEAKGEPWYVGDTYNVSIGQGDVLVSPLQITRAIAALANKGMLVSPTLEKDAQGEEVRVVDEDIANVVRDAMRETVTSGTARIMQNIPVAVAGKTGTAQWSSLAPPHSWFTGFAPFENPSVVITVLVEQGGDLTLATPIAHDILAWYAQERGF